MKTTLGTLLAGCTLALVLALPLAAQKPDTAYYKTAPVPVWVVVKQYSKEQVRVGTAIVWDDPKSGLPFAADVSSGELIVWLPTSKRGDDCAYSSEIKHGTDGYEKIGPTDDECASPPVSSMSSIGVTHNGSAMTCVEADRKDSMRDPTLRFWGCYWATSPGGGG